jgi:hypothetical protein
VLRHENEVVMVEKHVFGPFPHGITRSFTRADLEIFGIDHYRPSFAVLVFFNDPQVTTSNASETRPSYAGRFAVFGHESCTGDVGHCEVSGKRRRFDDRASHPLTLAFRRVVVTEALAKAVKAGDSLTITVIVSSTPGPDEEEVTRKKRADKRRYKKLLECKGIQLSTFS